VFILQTDAKSIQCFQKHAKLIENRFSRSKVLLTRMWEFLTRRWNAWHRESHCVFTAGGERVTVVHFHSKEHFVIHFMDVTKHYRLLLIVALKTTKLISLVVKLRR
jgi:hypothetical protein